MLVIYVFPSTSSVIVLVNFMCQLDDLCWVLALGSCVSLQVIKERNGQPDLRGPFHIWQVKSELRNSPHVCGTDFKLFDKRLLGQGRSRPCWPLLDLSAISITLEVGEKWPFWPSQPREVIFKLFWVKSALWIRSRLWSLFPKALCMNAGASRPHEPHYKSSRGPWI